MNEKIPIEEVRDAVILDLKNYGYKNSTVSQLTKILNKLVNLTRENGKEFYNPQIGQEFIESALVLTNVSERYKHERYTNFMHVIKMVESYIAEGITNIEPSLSTDKDGSLIKSSSLKKEMIAFISFITNELQLKPNTIDGYKRIVRYFIFYLEDRGYTSLDQIQPGDVTNFIILVCQEHYTYTSLGAHLPGLKHFLNMNKMTQKFIFELPEHLPKSKQITEIYDDEEIDRIHGYLKDSNVSSREKAITLLALDYGLRAIDICNMKIKDINWQNEYIHIFQEKTQKPMNITLSNELGEALANYLLSERPSSDCEYIFLNVNAPYRPLSSHAGLRNILKGLVTSAGVEANGRIHGTRITRHSMASKLLRDGVPLPVISEALGHRDPNITTRYITTDSKVLAGCTLPLPKVVGGHHE